MPADPGYGEATRAVHSPTARAPEQAPLGLPVYRTAAYAFSSSAEFADLLTGRRAGYSYGREGNPTSTAFADGVAALEAGGSRDDVTAAAFSSGMAAISTILLSLCAPGRTVVAPHALYGGTYGALTGLLARFGVRARLVDYADLDAVRAAVAPDTALIWVETLANPTMVVADLPALAAVARAAGVPLVVDSTFATPAVCRPLEYGADLVVHSATKYLGGHSDVMGGVVVGAPELVERIVATREVLGGVLAPDDAFLLHRGLATLPLRVARHCESALALALELAADRRLRAVHYPGLPGDPSHPLAVKLFRSGRFGGVVTVTLPGGRAAAAAACDAVRLAVVASSLGGTHTKVAPVATTSHRQLDDEALARAGIDPGMVRISVGLEDVDDLVADLDQALAAAVP